MSAFAKSPLIWAAFAWLLLACVHHCSVSAAIPSDNTATASFTETMMSSGEPETDAGSSALPLSTSPADETGGEGEGDEREYCPGYRQGNPGQLATETQRCTSGARIGVVNHALAFGIDSHVISPNWTACGIPFLPGENERVCYKTTVLQCPESYEVYLNYRNIQTLRSSCPNETDSISQSPFGGVFLQSPRYDCRNTLLNRANKYRKSEFCLYDVSLPECLSGRVVIDNDLHLTQEMERRQRYRICSDYLQFFTENSASKRFCDSELSRLKLEIPNTRFTALFWTDTSYNKLGFKLHVSCVA